ncbi:unnamed protein product [Mytilus coruscus]|uniref:CCHC-type domain-containing protein n=1 Tax=Mytilus coruscus TaxID=42192 RepID=A0A6J8EJC6_MYTCO|nr:unnamed protein product [Mytilus coruscus]
MSMPMMSSPFVTSPTQPCQMGAQYMPCPTPTQAAPATLQWATELLSRFEAMSVKINSIDEIKCAVSSVDFKLSEMKGDMNKLSKRVLDVETSQNFIAKSFDENIKMHEKTNKKIESDIKTLASEYEALRNDMSFIKRDSKNLSDSKTNLQKIFKANEKLNNYLESIKCESMRDNLLFHGIKESEGEDCALIIKSMCENNIDIDDELNIKTAFRLGKKNEVAVLSQNDGQERIRHTFVNFSDRQKLDSVRKRSYNLKSSTISITGQYPKSVVEKRKSLIPCLKKARDADVKAVLIKDKLFIGECWINNTCNIEIDDFMCKSIPLSRKKSINKGVPESQMIHYSAECPNIFVIGDLNARTANMNDFVQNDKLHDSILDRVGDLFTFVADEALSCRNNPDAGTNDYGTKLLNLCNKVQFDLNVDVLDNISCIEKKRPSKAISYLEDSKAAADSRIVKKIEAANSDKKQHSRKRPAEAAGSSYQQAHCGGNSGSNSLQLQPYRAGASAGGAQSQQSHAKPSDVCNKCGFYGHWARECRRQIKARVECPEHLLTEKHLRFMNNLILTLILNIRKMFLMLMAD